MAVYAKQVLSLRAIAKQSGTSRSFVPAQDEICLIPPTLHVASAGWPYFNFAISWVRGGREVEFPAWLECGGWEFR